MYIAHKTDDGREEPINDHLRLVAEKAAAFAGSFGSADWAYNMGILHDVGKYSDKFQRRIKESGPKVDHSSVGAYVMSAINRDIGPLLSYCIAGHHSGLPNGDYVRDSKGSSTLRERLKKAEKKGKEPFQRAMAVGLDLNASPKTPPVFDRLAEPNRFPESFWVRMMFSCLVDADYLATEEFMKGAARANLSCYDFAALRDRLEDRIAGFYPPTTKLNALRCELLDNCKTAATGTPGFYSLTVPTGGGKTLASMRFALNHLANSEAMGGRVIYALPYTSIIEQNADVFRETLGVENVLEHHSAAEFDSKEEGGSSSDGGTGQSALASDFLRLATENWDVPVIVTTTVQLFESLYASRPSRCRKLHSIANSVIVLDEAQMLPIPVLKPCLAALKELVDHYGCTVVFCTATQPALEGVIEGISDTTEICDFRDRFFDELKRVTYRLEGPVSDERLVAELADRDQVLCIVNSKKQARVLYAAVEGDGSFHLSTSMHPVHRRKTIRAIRERLENGLTCRVVATSLVEAGVDLDFPVVYRAMCGLDGIVQAAGRCNRNGRHPAEESVVHVFEAPGDYTVPAEIAQRAGIARTVMSLRGMLDEEEQSAKVALDDLDVLQDYFERLFVLRKSGMDRERAYEGLSTSRPESYPFSSVAERFHLVDGPGYSIVIPDDAVAAQVARLRDGTADRDDMRVLRSYMVDVYPDDFKRLSNCLTMVTDDMCVLDDLEQYSDETGLLVEDCSGKAEMW